MDRGAWQVTVYGVQESDTTERGSTRHRCWQCSFHFAAHAGLGSLPTQSCRVLPSRLTLLTHQGQPLAGPSQHV